MKKPDGIKRDKFTTALKPELIKKVKHKAVEDGTDNNKIIERALEEYFEREERP